MKTKQFAVFILFAVLMALMPINRAMSEDLLPPQQAIQNASDQLQKRLQDSSFTRDFKQITQFVNEVIYPHTDFDRISALVLGKLWKTAT
ncbi:MAG: ABC transporter substrate-binding protein, partial [Methylosarcina sp.]